MRRLEARRNMEETHYLTQKARNSKLNPPVDLRNLDYVSKYDDNLVCPICRCPLVDPVLLMVTLLSGTLAAASAQTINCI